MYNTILVPLDGSERAGTARDVLLAASDLVEEANARLEEALEQLGGPLEHHHHDLRGTL